MPHYPKPSFRPARGRWYVQFAGKQVNLGPDRTAAFKAYHGLMERRDQPSESPPASVAAQARLVAVVIDEFLEWCQKNRAADISRWYKDRLNSFCLTIPADLTTDLLKPHHVQKWVDGYKVPLALGSRRNLIASVKRCDAVARGVGVPRPVAARPHAEAGVRAKGTGRHAGPIRSAARADPGPGLQGLGALRRNR